MKHYSEIKDDLDAHARNWSSIPGAMGTTTINAMGTLEAVKVAWRRGYRWPASEVPTPATDALKRLEADETPLATLNRFRVVHGLELKYEERAVTHAAAMEKAAPVIAEQRKAEHEQRVAEQREQQVQAKLAELQAADAEAAASRLRAKAERAIG